MVSTENFGLSELQISDFLILEDGYDHHEVSSTSQATLTLPGKIDDGSMRLESATTQRNSNIKRKNGVKKNKVDAAFRVAFRTKSELEIMDDGFKWRKYGKKSVKNSQYPRNYYKCSSGGCSVKKRVERDRDDSSYVLTTYEGVHNHESPCVVYYNQMPLMVPNGWTLQQAPSRSSSS
nr:WRKY [Loropetalum chinense var. rubrum]